ncbi:MAG: helix-turn-helix domain-containing protein [Acidimicrobiaceae bacterium]|nr:helix-turn-helix domain-containing protein [Acidimicrobiaceae bacterium]MYH00053.1 helix-turn-helix domain-containing protein [Acidimicrobiaceae bacterium]
MVSCCSEPCHVATTPSTRTVTGHGIEPCRANAASHRPCTATATATVRHSTPGPVALEAIEPPSVEGAVGLPPPSAAVQSRERALQMRDGMRIIRSISELNASLMVNTHHLLYNHHTMIGQAEFASRFRERLRELLADSGRSQSDFAAEAGIDRSTLSQLLSAGDRRLPRAETLAAIAEASGASVDWLLGLTDGGPSRADIVHEEFALNLDELSSLDETWIDWHEQSAGSKIRTLPASLPDLVKTEAVIRHEVQRYATVRPEQRIETSTAPLELARAPGSDLECCNSIQAIEGFARGWDVWASLEHRHRVAQLDRMIELCEELYPTFRWFLYDSRQRYTSAITIFGLERAVLYLGQMYMVLNNRRHVTTFVKHFDDLIRVAVVQPPDMPRLLRKLRSEIT